MKTKTMKILTTIVTILLIIAMGMPIVLADSAIAPNSLNATYSNTNGIQNVGEKIMGIVQTAGVVIAVIVLMVLGIKYMMGSAEEKAEYKKTMIPYVVGAVLVFAGTSLVKVIYSLATAVK